MTERVAFKVTPARATSRLDVYLAGEAAVSRSSAALLIRTGKVLVNGTVARPSLHLHAGDVVEAEIAPAAALTAVPERIPLEIVYQDADLAIIDKPAGMVVHPAAGHYSGTLANALAAHFPASAGVGEAYRPGIVHRLDKDTSGLMMIALTDAARRNLQQQIATRQAGRYYWALVGGVVRPDRGTLEAPIGRDPRDRKRMWVHGIAGRPARTHFEVLEALPGFTLVEARLETGRTHQIRVHFAATGHPLAGDTLYGGARLPGLARQFLHAHALHLLSPAGGHELHFESTLPLDLQSVLDILRRRRGNSPADFEGPS